MPLPVPWCARWRRLLLTALLACAGASVGAAPPADWPASLEREIRRLDEGSPGELGVFVKRLDDGRELAYRADEPWYLGSATKLPIAIVLLQEVEAGRQRLDAVLALQADDRIEGPGPTVWQPAGTRVRVDTLLERMLMQSDNTAANMLLRAVGADLVNRRVRDWLGPAGFVGLTDFTRIRRDVYAELHPSARELPADALVRLAAAPIGDKRLRALQQAIDVEASALQAPSFDVAYERYYARGLNAAPLDRYAAMLEALVGGRLVTSPELLHRLYRLLKFETHDAYRLEAGLPRSVRFIHKTGTQHRRACHMGVVSPQEGGRQAVVVTACARLLDEHGEAGRLFEQVGRAITKTVLAPAADASR